MTQTYNKKKYVLLILLCFSPLINFILSNLPIFIVINSGKYTLSTLLFTGYVRKLVIQQFFVSIFAVFTLYVFNLHLPLYLSTYPQTNQNINNKQNTVQCISLILVCVDFLVLIYTLLCLKNTHVNKKALFIITFSLFTSKTRKIM